MKKTVPLKGHHHECDPTEENKNKKKKNDITNYEKELYCTFNESS